MPLQYFYYFPSTAGALHSHNYYNENNMNDYFAPGTEIKHEC